MIYLRFIFYYLYLVSLKQQTAEKGKLFFLIKNGSVYLFWEGAGNHNSDDEGMGHLQLRIKSSDSPN